MGKRIGAEGSREKTTDSIEEGERRLHGKKPEKRAGKEQRKGKKVIGQKKEMWKTAEKYAGHLEIAAAVRCFIFLMKNN